MIGLNLLGSWSGFCVPGNQKNQTTQDRFGTDIPPESRKLSAVVGGSVNQPGTNTSLGDLA